jgi:uncharacterized OsmC-like protein
MTTTTTPLANNGIAIEHMAAVREHIAEVPELGSFQWRARSQWAGGAQTRTSFDAFTGAGGEQSHRKTFTYTSDHPELFQQTDDGVTPPEFLLHALAACLTAGVASVAASRGITLTSVTAELAADMDVRGILGLDREVRNAPSQISVSFRVAGDASDEDLRKVVERSTQRSAVFDALTNGLDVVVAVES